jgi:hypothetical protein
VSTESLAQFVVGRARQQVAHFFFGLLTLETPRKFTALSAGEESPRSQALEDHHDRHRLVARECLVRRTESHLGEHTFVGITLATVDHVYSRPAADEIFVTLVVTPVK